MRRPRSGTVPKDLDVVQKKQERLFIFITDRQHLYISRSGFPKCGPIFAEIPSQCGYKKLALFAEMRPALLYCVLCLHDKRTVLDVSLTHLLKDKEKCERR